MEYVLRRKGTDDPELFYYDGPNKITLDFDPASILIDGKRAEPYLAPAHHAQLCSRERAAIEGLFLCEPTMLEGNQIEELDRAGAILPIHQMGSRGAIIERHTIPRQVRVFRNQPAPHRDVLKEKLAGEQSPPRPPVLYYIVSENGTMAVIEPANPHWRNVLKLNHWVHDLNRQDVSSSLGLLRISPSR